MYEALALPRPWSSWLVFSEGGMEGLCISGGWVLVLSVTAVIAWVGGVCNIVGAGGFACSHVLDADCLYIVKLVCGDQLGRERCG
jgi:hypothetical protein